MANGKRYANHRKDLLPTFLVSKKTKRNGEKPHTQIEMPPKLRSAVHPPPSFATFCETRISSLEYGWPGSKRAATDKNWTKFPSSSYVSLKIFNQPTNQSDCLDAWVKQVWSVGQFGRQSDSQLASQFVSHLVTWSIDRSINQSIN